MSSFMIVVVAVNYCFYHSHGLKSAFFRLFNRHIFYKKNKYK